METLLWQNGKPLDHILVLLCNNVMIFSVGLTNRFTFFPLSFANQNSIANGHLESAILLLEHGAMVDVPNKGIHRFLFNLPQ